MPLTPDLSPKVRAANVARLASERFDLLVVGGGISGAGIAAEAASRGLSVALVERGDFASGTSSKSSKLLHGGLRYLEQYRFHLVSEALGERNRLLREAPHVARELPFVYPIEHGRGPKMAQARLGLSVYDALSLLHGGKPQWHHRQLDPRKVERDEPCLAGADLLGAIRYLDGLTDDARLVIDVIKTAARLGAVVVNHCEVQAFVRDSGGRAVAALALDAIDQKVCEIRAARILNAAGPWVDAVNLLDDPRQPRKLLPTKGVHAIVPAFTRGEALAIKSLPHADGRRRWMFVIPWGDRSMIGTTDTAHPGFDKGDRYLDEDTEATAAEIEYLLQSVNAACPGVELKPSDVISAFGGYRPLIAPQGQAFESDISREHEIFETPSGILCLAGGKLTTYRVMARQVVDSAIRLLRRDGIRRGLKAGREPIPLGGSPQARQALALASDQAGRLPDREAEVIRRLIATYGLAYEDVYRLALAREDLSRELGGLCGLASRTRAEVAFAVRHEMALSVSDVLARRTRIQLLDDQAGLGAVEEVADLVSREIASSLEWEEDRRRAWAAREVERYEGQVRRMRAFR